MRPNVEAVTAKVRICAVTYSVSCILNQVTHAIRLKDCLEPCRVERDITDSFYQPEYLLNLISMCSSLMAAG